MKVTYNWIKEFIDLSVSPQELYEAFHKIGLEVDDFYFQGQGLDNVVVAHVEKREKHPDADKLSLCQVNTGDETVQIICGAANVKEGAKVVCAKIGAVLPGDFKIKKAKLRGVESFGMLCSDKEIGLAEKSDGIIILPEDAPVGTPISEYYELNDHVYSLETFANRPDHMGVMGISRDLSTYFDIEFKEKNVETQTNIEKNVFTVEIQNETACPRYVGRFVENVQNIQSPQYIKNRLIACDVRPIDFLVDITNYVMLETGHPMHAFDSRHFEHKKVIIRDSKEKEFEALNEKKYNLDSNNLIIANSEKAVALAGVIGGANSEVKPDTKNLFLESAYFEPKGILKTSRKVNLRTDSSMRFEKHANVEMAPYAIKLASKLLVENMGSDLKLYNIVDNYPSEIKKVNVNFDRNKIDKLLGCSIPAGEIDKILNRLPVKEVEKNVFEVCSSRKDLNIEVDFVEEIAKFYGYDNIEPKVIKMECTPYYNKLEKYFTISNKLSSLGFYEVKNFSLVNSEKDNSPKLVNPLSEEMKFMRTNMWEGMIKNVEYNAKRGMENHAYFETGKVYIHKNNEFFEENVASVVVAGNIFEMPGNNIKADYYYTKSVLESVLSGKKLTYRKNTIKEYLHPGISAEICVGDDVVGYIGKLHPSIKSKYFKDVFYFEFYPERLEGKKDFKIKQLSIFPTSKFDLSLIVPEKSTYQDIIMSIEKLKIEELDEIKLYDFYQGEKIPEGTISMTFRLKFTNVEKTLNDEEINEKISKILKTLKEIDVTLRAE